MLDIIESLFVRLVGDRILSPESFYDLTINELKLLIKRQDQKDEEMYQASFLAFYNAYGILNGGRKFTPQHPYDSKEKKDKKSPSKEKQEEALQFIEEYLLLEGGDEHVNKGPNG